MNILFYYSITANPQHGGIAKVTLQLCKTLINRGHSVFIISSTKTAESVVHYQYYLPDEKNFLSKKNEEFFNRFINEYKIDICVSQNGNAPDHNEAITWCNKLNIPIVTVVHSSLSGMYGIGSRMNPFHSTLKKLHLYNIGDKMFQYLFKRKYGEWYKYQGMNSDSIVLLSEKFKDEYYYYSNTKGDKVLNIPNMLTLQNNPTDIPKNKKKIVLFVGRISYEKQVDKLLEIWNQVYKEFPEWNLKIVGDVSHGSSKILTDLKETAISMGLKRYSFEGYNNPEPYYNEASVFCLTSSFEGFGLVLIEAMAYGTVPIAFNSYASASEIIDDNINGVLVKPFSIKEYANKLRLLMSNDSLRHTMSIDAKNKSTFYSPDRIATEWESLFRKMINNK